METFSQNKSKIYHLYDWHTGVYL